MRKVNKMQTLAMKREQGATITTGILFTLESLGASFTLLGTWEAQNSVIQFLLVSDKN
jgi:hypothetical protein